MADTARGHWLEKSCSDCGESGVVIFKHWGPLVPEGEIGHLCLFCWNEREKDCKEGKIPMPLGRKPFIEYCFIPGKIKVVTRNAVYRFDKPNKEKIRRVTRNGLIVPFPCRIKCLKLGKPLYLILSGCNKEEIEIPMWISSDVLSIEKG